jgi:hypothetical protein
MAVAAAFNAKAQGHIVRIAHFLVGTEEVYQGNLSDFAFCYAAAVARRFIIQGLGFFNDGAACFGRYRKRGIKLENTRNRASGYADRLCDFAQRNHVAGSPILAKKSCPQLPRGWRCF